jgi:2-oxoglutarate dehydrogenase E2 component (dihydrolipoamide succinyltransferase)
MPSNITVPEMGESVVDARVARWLKKEGDAVAVGDALVELETDKVDVEVSAQQPGVLERILHQEGADVKIGEVLGTIAAGAGAATASASSEPATSARPLGATSATNGRQVAATPSARKAARDQQVEISSVASNGPRVTKADVEKSARPAAKSSEPAPAAKAARCGPRASGCPLRQPRRRSPGPPRDRPAIAARNASACPSAARRSPSGSSKCNRRPRCSRPSTKWT